jgi:hypothetical protein
MRNCMMESCISSEIRLMMEYCALISRASSRTPKWGNNILDKTTSPGYS